MLNLTDREKWFKERTYHHSAFSDIERLLVLKETQSQTISVCLPTLNVADTVADCLRVIRTELVERHPLVDQLCVIDSRSTDDTIEIAEAEGAQVFFDDEILPEAGVEAGKGEALWKSLCVTTGDIVVWIDSDIENMHPRFVYGLVGPLLSEPDACYVKAFYDRPLRQGEVLQPSGGGRVTELTARPMLNLFYPELAALMQPLSGEYAGRRRVLESVPFFTGYGVEIGLLLDILREYGLWSLAQVDLEVRVHHNQPLSSLSKMSFGIMQALFARLQSEGRITLAEELSSSFATLGRAEEGYTLDMKDVRIVERPPVHSVPGYGARGGAA